ncbi:hypothetical protein ACH5RR_040714 [Cinchona calisaya]|uniref:Uncharacterized protein n=1 Tax=Cinchona calisaya TaxID=153742 RepID=A0ABD2XS85_9GENT
MSGVIRFNVNIYVPVLFKRIMQEAGVDGLNSKTHMKLMLKWMRGRNMLRQFCNHVGSCKKFMLSTLPEEPQVNQSNNSAVVIIKSDKPKMEGVNKHRLRQKGVK